MDRKPETKNVPLVVNQWDSQLENESGSKRLSILNSPIMQMTGHEAPVLTCSFSPDGKSFASGSLDKLIFLWNSSEDCKNYGVLEGHKGAVTQVKWADLENDKTIFHWSHETGERITKYVGHTNYINSICCVNLLSHTILSSGSDDATLRLWDSRIKKPTHIFKEEYQVLSTVLNKEGNIAFSAGIDGKINAWDIRSESILYRINAHTDVITGMKLSPDGFSLLSFSASNALTICDIRSSIPGNSRLQNSFVGCVSGFEKNIVRPCWSPDGYYVVCGSADKTLLIWDVISRNIVCKLPGHKGVINETDWWDNILLSCSNDCTLYIGEIDVESVVI